LIELILAARGWVVSSGGEFCEVMGCADHRPFGFDLVDAAKEELAEVSGLLDVSKE
jgi:hypothetical protein